MLKKAIQNRLPFERGDVTRNRHKGNPRSTEAHQKTRPRKGADRDTILRLFTQAGARGLTRDDVAILWDKATTTPSARISELKAMHLIAWNGKKRPTRTGCNADVMVLTAHAAGICQECGAHYKEHVFDHCPTRDIWQGRFTNKRGLYLMPEGRP